jgi:hypothetical protein
MNNLVTIIQQAWLGWGQTFIVAGGAVIVWMLSRIQSIGEIRKLQAELVTLRVNQFEKIIALDEKQRGIVARMYELLYQLTSAVQASDTTLASETRETIQKMFLLEYIGSYFHYTGLGRWVFPETRQELVDDGILPFLEASTMFLAALNQPEILNLTRQQPLVFNDFDFNFAFRFAYKYTKFWEVSRKRKLKAMEKTLLG